MGIWDSELEGPATIVRVLRLIEYEGERDWVDEMIQSRNVKGTRIVGRGVIRDTLLGDVPHAGPAYLKDVE